MSRTLSEKELELAIKKAGQPYFKKPPKISIELVQAYKQAGFSDRQIGLVLGVSATTINRIKRDSKR